MSCSRRRGALPLATTVALLIGCACVLLPVARAEFGETEGKVDALADAPPPTLAEENARLRAEVASMRTRLHLPPIADGRPNAAPGGAAARAGNNAPAAAAAAAAAAAGAGVSLAAMEKALAGVRAARAALLKYYEGDAAMLDAAPSFPSADDKLLVGRMGLAALGMRAHLVTGGGPGSGKARAFVVGVTGSSVTAGHDTFGPVAWPHVLARNMAPLWAALGVEFVLRDAAVGGRDPNPWPFCLAQMMGEDVDVVMREAEYWPWDAGFAPTAPIAKEGASRTAAAFEIFIRQALSLPRKPVVHFLRLDHGSRADGVGFMNEFLGADKHGGGLRGAYAPALPRFGINAFDAFGKPFNHLLERLGDKAASRPGKPDQDQWPAVTPTPCRPEAKGNVADCPVDVAKQDGHHASATDNGYDAKLHPEYEKWFHRKGNSGLFVNWHPAPLGHEVIGNQVAYYHMGALEAALAAIVKGMGVGAAGLAATVAAFKAAATGSALPAAVACSDTVCPISTTFRPQCAYSYLPKAQGPDVGDIMVNGTAATTAAAAAAGQTGWVNKLVDRQAPCEAEGVKECDACAAKGDGVDGCQVEVLAEHCFDTARHCSYLDWKRGMRGDGGSGPITLGFKNMFQCLIWIGEPPYEWNKPKQLANWAEELAVKVNGKPCAAPHCTIVKSSGYTQVLQVDARGLMGGKCRRQEVKVSLEVKPKGPKAFACSGSCEPSGAWSGYANDLCVKEGGTCTRQPRYVDKKEIRTFVSYAISF